MTSSSTSPCRTSTRPSLPYYLSISPATPTWKVLPWLFSLPGVVFFQIPSHLTLSPANSNIKVMYNCNSLPTSALPWYHYLFSIVLLIKPSKLLYNLFTYHDFTYHLSLPLKCFGVAKIFVLSTNKTKTESLSCIHSKHLLWNKISEWVNECIYGLKAIVEKNRHPLKFKAKLN